MSFTYKIPSEQQYLSTLVSFLKIKDEKELVQIIENGTVVITPTSTYSGIRWDAYKTTVTFSIPIVMLAIITEKQQKKLREYADVVMPKDAGFDVVNIEISPLMIEEDNLIIDEFTELEVNSPTEIHHKCDILVITATPEEYNSIKKLLENVTEYEKKELDITTYLRGLIKNESKTFDIVVPYPSGMGMSPASIITTKALNLFMPKYLFMVGIAAGNRNISKIGDLIIADQSLDYNEVVEIEKKLGEDTIKKFRQKAPLIDVSLKGKLEKFRDSDIPQKVYESFEPKKNIPNEVKCHIGVLVTGSSLMRSESKIKDINASFGNVKGLDMETYAVYNAAIHMPKDKIPYFVSMKAVSDFGENHKHKLPSEIRKQYALHTSSHLFKLFILNFID